MAQTKPIITMLSLALISSASSLTCPGFPGFCSESFPGQTCQVVCSTGRNNVPLCQDDGTWTDIPRCVEHEPGVEEQIPGLCPGVSGYCPSSFLHGTCRFDCPNGPDIDSVCTADGTWSPYPVCQGDVRELRDGCDGCPGPVGRLRNRTAEAQNQVNTDRRIPKTIQNDGGRKTVPSFAGNINIGPLDSEDSRLKNPVEQKNPRQQQFFQQNVRQQRPRQNSLFAEQFPQNTQQQSPQPNVSLFDQIKARAQGQGQGQGQGSRTQNQQFQPQVAVQRPRQETRGTLNTFGVFESVNLGANSRQQQQGQQQQQQQRQQKQQQQAGGGFFGAFQSVDLQG